MSTEGHKSPPDLRLPPDIHESLRKLGADQGEIDDLRRRLLQWVADIDAELEQRRRGRDSAS